MGFSDWLFGRKKLSSQDDMGNGSQDPSMIEPILISDGENEDNHSDVIAPKNNNDLGFEIVSECIGTKKACSVTTSKSPLSTPAESPAETPSQAQPNATNPSLGNGSGSLESAALETKVENSPSPRGKNSILSPLPELHPKTTIRKEPAPEPEASSNSRLDEEQDLGPSPLRPRCGSQPSSQPQTHELPSSHHLYNGGSRKRHLLEDEGVNSQEYQELSDVARDADSPVQFPAPPSTTPEVTVSALPKRAKVDPAPTSSERLVAKHTNGNKAPEVALQAESSIFAGVTWTGHVHTKNIRCLVCKSNSGAIILDDLLIMEILNEHFVLDEPVNYTSPVPLKTLFETAQSRYAPHVPNVRSFQIPRILNWVVGQPNESRPCSDGAHDGRDSKVHDLKRPLESKVARKASNSPSDSRSSRKSGPIATEDAAVDIDPSEIPNYLDQIPDGYVFYPTEEEFMDPALYLRKVYPLAAATGVFKIVPPPSWRNKSAIDNLWPIRTNVQPIHKLIMRDAAKEQNFGYEPGPQEDSMWVAKYEAAAKTYKDAWIRRNHVCDENRVSPLTSQKFGMENAALERQYWKILSSGKDPVFTLYANDMDSREIYGPEHETFVSKRKPNGCTIVHPWSLMVLPKYPDMLLSSLVLSDEANPKQARNDGRKDERSSPSTASVDDAKMRRRMRMSVGKLSGVCQPWIYFGMLFSSFCWHVEDNNLYSINYLHEGQSKFWYGIPPGHAQRYEMIFNRLHSDKFKQDWNNIYYNINTMMNPAVLVKNGVKVFRLLQHPGEIIITVPESYHAGFSTGYNCAEAVNFALPNWFSKGLFSERRLFIQKEDTIRVTRDESRQMKSYYIDCLNEEKANRKECEKWYGQPRYAQELRLDEEPMCFYCEQPCPFSVVKFNDMEEDQRSLCLRHGASLKNVPECGFLIYYVSLEKLENALRHADYVCNIQEFETLPDTPEMHDQIRKAIRFDQKSPDFCPACECRSERKAPWACSKDLEQWFGSKLMDL